MEVNMETTDIISSITEMIKDLLQDIDDAKILLDDDLYITSSMSSIDYVKLLVLLEEKYEIEFDENMLIYDEGFSIASIAECVLEKVKCK